MPSQTSRAKSHIRRWGTCFSLCLTFSLATGVFYPLNASAQPSTSISGPLYGGIPNITIDGIPSGSAPWVVNGHVSFGAGRVTVTGSGLFIAAGYTSTGSPVPTKLVGTTGGLTSVSIEVRDATGGTYLSSPVPLSSTGSFSFSAPVQLSEPITDPVVMVGTVGTGGTLRAWIASSDFLADFGRAGRATRSPSPPPLRRTSSLEALGTPSFSSPTHCSEGTYTSTAQNAKLMMGGQSYSQGFQFHTDGSNCIDHWTWHIRGKFWTFSSLVGLDSSNSTVATISLLGPNGSPLTLNANGRSTTSVDLASGVATRISLNIKGLQNLAVVTSGTSGASATIDFANDVLAAP